MYVTPVSLVVLIFSCHAFACIGIGIGHNKGLSYDSDRAYDSVYPKLSIGSYGEDIDSDADNKAVGVSSDDRVSRRSRASLNLQLIRIGRITSYIALGYLVIAALSNLCRGRIPMIDSVLGIKHLKEQNQLLQVENESLKQLMKEQDEIWNAILNIHNAQNAVKLLAESNAASISEWKSTLTNLELELRRSLDELTPRMDDLDRGLTANNEDTVEKIRRIQQLWDSEMKSIRASFVSLQQEIPAILKDHDKIITSKFQSFKEDMKKIIVTGNSSSISSKRK